MNQASNLLTTAEKKELATLLKVKPHMSNVDIKDITDPITCRATEITFEDVQQEFRKLNTGSAPGPSGLDKDHFNFPRRAD